MRKLFLVLALAASLCANAQLTVFENGLVRLGDYSTSDDSWGATLDISSSIVNSTRVTPQGTVTFGAGSGASIKGCSTSGTLSAYATNTLSLGVNNYTSALCLNGTSKKLSSVYEVTAPSFLTSSDARVKKNVEPLSEFMQNLKEVNAVSYNLTSAYSTDTSLMTAAEAESADEEVDDRIHFGFIAQEIQKVYPNLVVEDQNGILAIDYTGFIPLLVEAYKDLAEKVKEQEETIDALLGKNGPAYMPSSVNELANAKASLKQNKPNPFNNATAIECSVPQNVASAFLCIYDLQGKQVHRIDIRERGNIVNVIDASYFAPGMYIYTLIADGMEIDSKRMIITD